MSQLLQEFGPLKYKKPLAFGRLNSAPKFGAKVTEFCNSHALKTNRHLKFGAPISEALKFGPGL